MYKLIARRVVPVLLLGLLLIFGAQAAMGAHHAGSTAHRARHHRKHRRAKHRNHARQGAFYGTHMHPGHTHHSRHKRRVTSKVPLSHAAATQALLIGDTTVESNAGYLSSGRAKAFNFHARLSGTSAVMQLYLDPANTAGTVIVGIYSDAGGHPGSLLSTGLSLASLAGTWNPISVTSAPLVAKESYWLATLGQGGTLRFRDQRYGSCKSETSAQGTLSALPTSWRTGRTHSNCPVSAYVTGSNPVSVEPPNETIPPPPPPPPPPPTASFTYSPSSPVTGQAVTFNADGSSCSDGPCTYAWSDDGGPTQPSTTLWPLGTGQTLVFTFQEATTKYVRLTVTDAAGQTATVEHNVVVSAEPPPNETPPPATSAPVNTAAPTITGTATEGLTLSASQGVWSEEPTSYAYQWQDCNGSGENCANIAGATVSSYKLTSADVGHTLRVVVTASNAVGSASATSAATATVAMTVTSQGCTTTISSGLQSAIANAAAGSTICLNAGNYGAIEVDSSKSSTVTITPAGGVARSSVVLGYTNVRGSAHLTFKNLTVGGAVIGVPGGSPATYITFLEDNFTSSLCIHVPTNANIHATVESSLFNKLGESCTEGRIGVTGDNVSHTVEDGVVIAHNIIGHGGCADGVMQNGGAEYTQIGPGNEFVEMKEGSCVQHVDPIQFYGAHHTKVLDNWFHGNSTGIMSPDGNGSPMIVEGNVFDTDGEYPNQVVDGGGENDVFNHNTFGHGASIRLGKGNTANFCTNTTITNNVLTGGLSLTEGQTTAGLEIDYNLSSDSAVVGSHGLTGLPTYVAGGSEPSTWTGWQLASGSLGHVAAGDGTNMGSNYFGP